MGLKKYALFSCLLVLSVAVSSDIAAEEKGGGMTGTLVGQIALKGGGPLSGGMVFFFNTQSGPPPSSSKYWRVPDEAAEIDKDGRFRVELPAGGYYLGAMKKASGDRVGPPMDGDIFFENEDERGNPRVHAVKKGELTDIGTLSGAAPFVRKLVKQGVTAIEGAVLTMEGRPVEGVMVFAFKSQSLVGRPLYVTDRTGKDGKFILRVAEGGNYYLKVRDVYGGGPPEKGAALGSYGDGEPVAVAVKTGGTTTGVQIKVIRFPGRGPIQD